jgi:hypothetical protein
MHRTAAMFATLSLATAALFACTASAAETAGAQAADHPTAPVPDGTKIGKSRPNIQNNREATPPVKPADTNAQSSQIVKSKTKSNQSND